MAPPTADARNSSLKMEQDIQTESEAVGTYINMVTKMVLENNLPRGKETDRVVEFRHPKELEELLDLQLENEGKNPSEMEKILHSIMEYSVKTASPRFYNQLYQGVDEAALAGDWLGEALNTNQYTFEVAPVFSIVEHKLMKHILSIVGYKSGDGIFAPGGSIGNMYGMVMARYKTYPDVKSKGIWGKKPLVAFTSEDSHYSILKAAHWMGMGTDYIVKVKTDHGGRMIAEELEKEVEKAKQEGKTPYFVNATAGTTVLGGHDRLPGIADVCKKHDLWLHVDGAWGGSAMLSSKYKYLMEGIERADSYIWNPHKMLGVPLQCTVFVTRHKDMLHHCNSASATYLFQQDKFYDVSYDTGDKSVQCGRKADSFKLWVMWKTRGDQGLADRVDKAFYISRYLQSAASKRPGFRVVLEDIDAPNVCFWYIPKRLRGKPETEEWWEEVSKVAPAVKEKMVKSGSMMVGYQPLPHKGFKNFFRFVFSTMPERTTADMDFIISEIEQLGEEF